MAGTEDLETRQAKGEVVEVDEGSWAALERACETEAITEEGIVMRRVVPPLFRRAGAPKVPGKRTCSTCNGSGVMRRAWGRLVTNEQIYEVVTCNCVHRRARRRIS